MDKNISLALTRIETWLGSDVALCPELFVASDILRHMCESENLDVIAANSPEGSRIWFYRGEIANNSHWLWMLELLPGGLMMRIRTTSPTAHGKTFLSSLMGQVYSFHDAMQLIEWWDTKVSVMPVAISSYLPQDPEVLVDIFGQLEIAMREVASQ